MKRPVHGGHYELRTFPFPSPPLLLLPAYPGNPLQGKGGEGVLFLALQVFSKVTPRWASELLFDFSK